MPPRRCRRRDWRQLGLALRPCNSCACSRDIRRRLFLPHPDLPRSPAGLRAGPGSWQSQLSAPLRPLSSGSPRCRARRRPRARVARAPRRGTLGPRPLPASRPGLCTLPQVRGLPVLQNEFMEPPKGGTARRMHRNLLLFGGRFRT